MQTRQKALLASMLSFMGILFLLIFTIALNGRYFLIFSLIAAILSVLPFFVSFETRKPQARELVPIAILSAIAVAGRVLFSGVPSFQPATAIIIITGIVFGPQTGFMTGAITALLSNVFLGQGIFTPWQMTAWGLCGLLAGLIREMRFMQKRWGISLYGAACGYFFGLIMNLFTALSFFEPTIGIILSTLAAGFWFDTIHAFSNVFFLALFSLSWIKKLNRVKVKYGLFQTGYSR